MGLGRVKVSGDMLCEFLKLDDSSVLGVRAVPYSDSIDIEFLIASPMFEELKEGEAAPVYELWHTRSEDGTVTLDRVEKGE